MYKISVILCTHNPKRDYLQQALDSIKKQTFPSENWELLIVDNASTIAVEKDYDISWNSSGRIIREDILGLTAARLRGIKESNGELLVFVDDDNILDSNYLEIASRIAHEKKYVGSFGGQLIPIFEKEPEPEISPYLHLLAIRKLENDKISNQYFCDTSPAGAGMVIRKSIALKYRNNVLNDPIRQKLDRFGKSLLSGGDTDLVWTSIDEGYLNGLFVDLKLQHLMPKERLNSNYILNLYENIRVSSHILRYARFGELILKRITYLEKIRLLFVFLLKGRFEFEIYKRELNSRRLALNLVSEIEGSVSQNKNE